MKVTSESLEKNQVVLTVEVEPEKFAAALKTTIRKVANEVNIPGFRKGKAPKVILEQYVGREMLWQETADSMLNEVYAQAVKESGTRPVAQPEAEIVQAEEGKESIFKFTVTVRPDVILGQYKDLEITKTVHKVTEEDLEKELAALQNNYAELETLEEGTVQDKDTAVIDFEGKLDGIPFAGGKADDYSLEIGSHTFIEGFEEQVMGMQVGETRELNLTFPENYGKEELNGKAVVFTVTVKLIKRKKMAEIDDEFAKDVSEFNTLEELKADIRKNLETNQENLALRDARAQLLELAAENAQIDLPEAMIDTYLEDSINAMRQRMNAQGMPLEMYLQYTGSNMEELRKRYRGDAEKDARKDLVAEAIAKELNITVNEKDVEEEGRKIAEEVGQDYEVVKKILDTPEQQEFMRNSIIRDRVLIYLVDHAKITTVVE